jgi:hypothetical protein
MNVYTLLNMDWLYMSAYFQLPKLTINGRMIWTEHRTNRGLLHCTIQPSPWRERRKRKTNHHGLLPGQDFNVGDLRCVFPKQHNFRDQASLECQLMLLKISFIVVHTRVTKTFNAHTFIRGYKQRIKFLSHLYEAMLHP